MKHSVYMTIKNDDNYQNCVPPKTKSNPLNVPLPLTHSVTMYIRAYKPVNKSDIEKVYTTLGKLMLLTNQAVLFLRGHDS